MLAEDDDAHARMRLTELSGEADALIGLRRRHSYVGYDDVRSQRADCRAKRVQILECAQKVDLGQLLQRTRDSLAGEIAVLTEYDANAQDAPKERTSGRSGTKVGFVLRLDGDIVSTSCGHGGEDEFRTRHRAFASAGRAFGPPRLVLGPARGRC